MTDGDGDGSTLIQADALRSLRSTTRRRPELTWQDRGGAHGVRLDGTLVLGSAPHLGLVVDDPAVSRLHAELELRDDGVWVRDLGSRNGTFIHEVRVERARLDPGVELRVGGTAVRLGGAEATATVELWPSSTFGPLVGGSVASRELYARLDRIAAQPSTVLVEGETGTGKELIARAIHEASPRREGPYVIVDCGAMPESLLEAELFGYVRGAFTGAGGARQGALLEADGGTVFLDEIGELPLAMQPKLLRFLESRTIRRIGENIGRRVEVRVIAATHRNLRQMVNAGAFREDLYFRLAVLPVHAPPLRERTADIPALVEHFLPPDRKHLCTPELLAEVRARPWLGNVRELRNFVERAIAFGPDEALRMAETHGEAGTEDALIVSTAVPLKELRERWVSHLEREYLTKVLAETGGNVSAAARAAGIDRTSLHRLILKHRL